MQKQAPNLGFELDELEETVDRYRDPAPAATAPDQDTPKPRTPRKTTKPRTTAKKPAARSRRTGKAPRTPEKASPAPTPTSPPSPSRPGRPRSLPGSRACSFRLTDDQYRWLLTESANRTLDTGERHDASMLVRELIDRARGAS